MTDEILNIKDVIKDERFQSASPEKQDTAIGKWAQLANEEGRKQFGDAWSPQELIAKIQDSGVIQKAKTTDFIGNELTESIIDPLRDIGGGFFDIFESGIVTANTFIGDPDVSEALSKTKEQVVDADRQVELSDKHVSDIFSTDLDDIAGGVDKLNAGIANGAASLSLLVASNGIAGKSGALLMGLLLNTSESVKNQKNAGATDTEAITRGLPAGMGKAALDVFSFNRITSRLPGSVKGKIFSILGNSLLEGSTETAQEVIDVLALVPGDVKDEQLNRIKSVEDLFDVFAPSAVLGGTVGTLSGTGQDNVDVNEENAGSISSDVLQQDQQITDFDQQQDQVTSVVGKEALESNEFTADSKIKQDAINARSFKDIYEPAASVEPDSSPIVDTGLVLKNETILQKFSRKILDANERIKVVQNEIEQLDGNIREESDVFMAKRLSNKRVSARVDHIEKTRLEPFTKKIAKLKVSIEDVDLFAHAKHAQERNAEMGGDGLSGMTNVQAQQVLSRFENEGKTPNLESLHQDLSGIIDEHLDYQTSSGILSQEESDALRSNYQFYVPLGREMQEFSSRGGFKSKDVRTKGIFRAKGSTRQVLPITAQVFNKISKGIELAETNIVGNAMASLVKENPASNIWTIESPKAIGTRFGKDGEIIRAQPKNNQFSFFENGKQKLITINDPLILRALKNEGLSKSIPILRGIISLQSKLITAYDLTFAVRNPQRDVSEAIINLQEIRELQLNEEQSKSFTRDIVKSIPSIGKGLFKHLRGKSNKWSEAITQFQLDGGQSGSFWLEDVKQLNKRLLKFERQYKRQGFKQLLNVPGNALDFIKTINEVAENSTRVAVYDGLVKRGVSRSKSAFIAGEITIDFNRQGELGPLLKSLYLFINPSIQGTARVSRAFGKSNRVRAAAGALTVAGFMRTYLSMMLDEEADEAIFDYTKNTSITFPIPGADTSATLVYLPYGYNSFFALGSNLAYLSAGKKTKGEVLKDTALAAMDSINPLGGSRLSYTNAAPSIIKPLVEIEKNEGWHGGPIYPSNRSFKAKQPDSENYWKSVGDFSKFTAKWMALISATEQNPKGFIDVSPESIEYAVAQYGGNVGRGIANTLNTSASLLQDNELPKSSHVPFLREILRDIDVKRYKRNLLEEMYDQSRITKFSDREIKQFNEAIQFVIKRDNSTRKILLKKKKEFEKNQKDL